MQLPPLTCGPPSYADLTTLSTNQLVMFQLLGILNLLNKGKKYDLKYTKSYHNLGLKTCIKEVCYRLPIYLIPVMAFYENCSQARLSASISPRYIIVMVKKLNHSILRNMTITEAWKLINTQLHILSNFQQDAYY